MKKSNRTFFIISLIFVTLMPLQACSLLPKEEEQHQVQIMHKDVTADYGLARAQIDDVIQTKEIACYYEQMNEDKVSFSEDGKNVDIVYVQKGDTVKKGDILARLNSEDIDNELEDLKDQVEKEQLQLKQAKESYQFYRNKLDSRDGSIVDIEQYLWEVQDCNETSREYTDHIATMKQRIESLKEELKKSVIVAGKDGTVIYIWDKILTKQTHADQTVMKIADTNDCAFLIDDMAAAEYLTVGQEVNISVSDTNQYKAVVSDIDSKNSKINLSIQDNDYTMDVGARGTIKLLLATKEKVLTIPKAALHSNEEFHYVYYLDENGVRNYKKVSVGLIGDSLVQITDGLKENDSIITK